MAGVNKVILVGNLGADPEVKYLSNGTTVANFRIATSENRVNKTSGEKTTVTEWHRIVAFGRLAEICGEYLNKGKQVYIEGRIRTRSWEDKEGTKRFTTEIVATQMQMLGAAGASPVVEKDHAFDQEAGPEPAQVTTMSPSDYEGMLGEMRSERSEKVGALSKMARVLQVELREIPLCGGARSSFVGAIHELPLQERRNDEDPACQP